MGIEKCIISFTISVKKELSEIWNNRVKPLWQCGKAEKTKLDSKWLLKELTSSSFPSLDRSITSSALLYTYDLSIMMVFATSNVLRHQQIMRIVNTSVRETDHNRLLPFIIWEVANNFCLSENQWCVRAKSRIELFTELQRITKPKKNHHKKNMSSFFNYSSKNYHF